MRLKIKEQPVVQCGICGKPIPIDNDLGWDEISRDNDRSQGIAITYQSNPIDVQCPYCNHNIEYQIEVTEYPEGKIEDIDINITGGIVLEKPMIGIE